MENMENGELTGTGQLTAITGPMRSGTSCLTGLLELCGFDLGKRIRVLRNSTEFNNKGHFETDLLFTINNRLLEEVPGGLYNVFSVPDEEALTTLASEREKYFRLFIQKFDGNLFKDPLLCLTYHLWEKRWPELNRVIFCLRHPLSVALSMQNRYMLSLDYCFNLWLTYVNRFFDSSKRSDVYIFDFDAFIKSPSRSLAHVLEWLGADLSQEDIQNHVNAFYDSQAANSDGCREKQCQEVIPDVIKARYSELIAKAD